MKPSSQCRVPARGLRVAGFAWLGLVPLLVCSVGLAAEADRPELAFYWISEPTISTFDGSASVDLCVTAMGPVDARAAAVFWVERNDDLVAAVSRRFAGARSVCANVEIPRSEYVGAYRTSVSLKDDARGSIDLDPCALGFGCEIRGVRGTRPRRVGAGPWAEVPFGISTRLSPCEPTDYAPPREARVALALGDGTLILEGGERVRLVGNRFPQSEVPGRSGEDATDRTLDRLTDSLGRDPIWLYADPRLGPVDSEGRTLAYVVLADGTVLNRRLVEEGYATADPSAPYCSRFAHRRSQVAAEKARRGLWSSGDVFSEIGE